MPRPISGNQLAKLGRRLARPGPISDEDYEMLARVAEVYQAVLDNVEQRLRLLGYHATTRVKTTGTLVDKLRRTPQLPLGSIHDVAGARIVIEGGRWEQDQVVERIMTAFADCPKVPQKIDRREKPSYNYRAVHVIVFEEATPVEVQVRTKLQDTWAQISEKLGDLWGRGLRYGHGPDLPEAPAIPDTDVRLTRRETVASLPVLADAIDGLEQAELHYDQAMEKIREAGKALADVKRGVQGADKIAEAQDVQRRHDELVEEMRASGEQLADYKQGIQTTLDTVLQVFRALGGEQ